MNCSGLWGRLFGHDYQPIYSKSEPTIKLQRIENIAFAEEIVAVLEASKNVTYHGSLCHRCGHVVKEAA